MGPLPLTAAIYGVPWTGPLGILDQQRPPEIQEPLVFLFLILIKRPVCKRILDLFKAFVSRNITVEGFKYISSVRKL